MKNYILLRNGLLILMLIIFINLMHAQGGGGPLPGDDDKKCTLYFDYDNSGNRISRDIECDHENPDNDDGDIGDLFPDENEMFGDDSQMIYNVMVYPNPVNDVLHYSINEYGLESLNRIEVLDVNGSLVHIPSLNPGFMGKIRVENLRSGHYWIRFIFTDDAVTKKIIRMQP